MSLEELDNLIKTMEGSINEIRNYQVIYKELTNLQSDISQSIENLQSNKDALDSLNSNITMSVENLKKQVEELNSILPQKMLEIVSSNKDIQIDIKTKHEELIRIYDDITKKNIDSLENLIKSNAEKHNELVNISNNNTQKTSEFMKKLSLKTIILTVIISIMFIFNIVDFIMRFIK